MFSFPIKRTINQRFNVKQIHFQIYLKNNNKKKEYILQA